MESAISMVLIYIAIVALAGAIGGLAVYAMLYIEHNSNATRYRKPMHKDTDRWTKKQQS